MLDTPLVAQMIDDASHWRLALRTWHDGALSVLIHSPESTDSLIYSHFSASAGSESPLVSLEEIIYANPLLTEAEFASVDCIVGNAKVLVVPPEAGADDCDALFRFAGIPGADSSALSFMAASGLSNASIYFTVPEDIEAFFRRTFFGIRFHSSIEPLCRYFSMISGRGNGKKMFVNFRDNELDILAIDRNKLLLANRFEFVTSNDAVYYILACRAQLELNNDTDPIMICGNGCMRSEISSILGDFVSQVMPVIFPSAFFRAGNESMEAPFDLIAMASLSKQY